MYRIPKKLGHLIALLNAKGMLSQESMAKQLATTPSSIRRYVNLLNKQGLLLRQKEGFSLKEKIALLDPEKIKNAIQEKRYATMTKISLHLTISSTNDYFKTLTVDSLQPGLVCLAEQQTKGKGRRNRVWFSPFAANIYLSFLWKAKGNLDKLNGLSLVTSLAVLETLEKLGIKKEISIKWPNDVLWKDKKLAGTLLEIYSPLFDNIFYVIIGIGLNVNMLPNPAYPIQQPWTSIRNVLGAYQDRSLVAGLLISQIYASLEKFENEGLLALLSKWRRYDYLFEKNITLVMPHKKVVGMAMGVNHQGSLLVRHRSGEILPYSSGEVTVRLLACPSIQ
jgi:BirA family transcriptional regulator, biotin operon repressor / biotin---[acetyl-CoA-carboxylase] ligase